MLFAQAAADVVGWITAAINLGALGILGFYFLKVQPSMSKEDHRARMEELRLIASVFRENKEGFDQVTENLTDKITELREGKGCRFNPGEHA